MNEKQLLNLNRLSMGGRKIKAIKEIRAACGVGLKEAKEFVDCEFAGL